MKVAALVLFALVAVVAADSYGRSHGHYNQDYQVPNWNRHETRDGYNHVKGDWWVELPGKSHIKNDYDIKSQERVSVIHGNNYGHNAGHSTYGHKSY